MEFMGQLSLINNIDGLSSRVKTDALEVFTVDVQLLGASGFAADFASGFASGFKLGGGIGIK